MITPDATNQKLDQQ